MTRLLVLIGTKIISPPRELTLKRVSRSLLAPWKIQANRRVRTAWCERRISEHVISLFKSRQPLCCPS